MSASIKTHTSIEIILAAAREAKNRMPDNPGRIFAVECPGNLRGSVIGDQTVHNIWNGCALMSAKHEMLGYFISTGNSNIQLIATRHSRVVGPNGRPACELI